MKKSLTKKGGKKKEQRREQEMLKRINEEANRKAAASAATGFVSQQGPSTHHTFSFSVLLFLKLIGKAQSWADFNHHPLQHRRHNQVVSCPLSPRLHPQVDSSQSPSVPPLLLHHPSHNLLHLLADFSQYPSLPLHLLHHHPSHNLLHLLADFSQYPSLPLHLLHHHPSHHSVLLPLRLESLLPLHPSRRHFRLQSRRQCVFPLEAKNEIFFHCLGRVGLWGGVALLLLIGRNKLWLSFLSFFFWTNQHPTPHQISCVQ